jgi:late competence protein required for DNA uptake (superfamily II DNA/RNA helicase)
MFPYELELYGALQNYKDICIKKSRGIGGSEFILRYLIWLALSQNGTYKGKRFHIVTGPRIDIASDLIKRTKDIVSLNYPQLVNDSKEVIANIAGVIFQAFPSHTVNTMRGYTDVKAIVIDEA